MATPTDQMTDAQFLAAMATCPPDAKIVGWAGQSVAVRRPDGSGVLIAPSGEAREFSASGTPV